ncbi:LacI family DNA-binding transcriptional regulator [Catenulispora sp. EB89]|uniref:LacI family DNA-binding transcriptional regulator n=1 Tax=Catenulispora sp. EB89 TaxID=3156257 RepID=UPI003516C13D
MSERTAQPTLADVAAMAGVSVATASRALNGSAGVSRSARADVHAAAARLSYVRLRTRSVTSSLATAPVTSSVTSSVSAASVARSAGSAGSARACQVAGSSGLVAAIVCEDGARMFADSFFSRLLLGVTGALPAGEVQLAMLAIRGAADRSAAERFLTRSRPDGVLMISAHDGDPVAACVRTLGVPTVLAGRPLSGNPHSYIDVDNRAGAAEAVEHLIASGRREIVTIAGPQDMAAGVDRLAGYRDAVRAAGMPQVSVVGDFSGPSGERAMASLLNARPNLDAVFAASDLMAAGALRALCRAGRRVPDDVAVVGFDDAPLAAHTRPPLTTVRQPVEDMGAAMARQLLRGMADGAGRGSGPVEPVILGTTLVRRGSS